MAGAALAMRPAVWALHCLLGRPRDSMLAIVVAGSVGAIAVNSLMLQHGPHPAPIFAHVMQNPPPGLTRGDVLIRRNNEFVPPAPAAAAPPAQRTAISEEPTGAVVPMLPRARPPEAPPKVAPAATRPAAMRKDPIGELITPSPQAAAPQPAPVTAAPTTQVAAALLPAAAPQPAVAASPSSSQPSPQIASVQRVLGSFGYLQMSPNGVMGPETKRAIEEFERERRLPVTGQVSDRLVRELSVVTGKSL
jgi:hypothetical protein